jgi:hypothetical protein
MYSIEIDSNESVNPCIITPKGEFVPRFHSILIKSDDSNNWYLGTIWIGNNEIDEKIPRDIFSEIITRVSKKVDLVITFSNSAEFAIKISARIAQFIQELQKETTHYVSDIYMSEYSNKQNIIEKITLKLANTID